PLCARLHRTCVSKEASMTAASAPATGCASRGKSAFRLSYRVAIPIQAPPQRIWALLTVPADFRRWNSTVQGIEGETKPGAVIQLRATVAPERIFKLTVSEFQPESRLVWRDGRAPIFSGVRTYLLTPRADDATDFSMEEVFSGLMLPMIAGSLPDFA